MNGDLQRKNQLKQHEESLKKQQEYNNRLAPVKVQDKYNKENLEIQHKYNLEIFEKQAALTREINAKQSKLTKVLIISTVLAAILGSAIGALLPNFIKNIWPQNEQKKTSSRIVTSSTKKRSGSISS
ncbi:MAG: hypothetical protein WAW09_10470 [Smithella sp.]